MKNENNSLPAYSILYALALPAVVQQRMRIVTLITEFVSVHIILFYYTDSISCFDDSHFSFNIQLFLFNHSLPLEILGEHSHFDYYLFYFILFYFILFYNSCVPEHSFVFQYTIYARFSRVVLVFLSTTILSAIDYCYWQLTIIDDQQ